eukprot:SAG25_NODE_1370_length_3187_cov_2.210492_2_plen_238_part_00
MRQPPRQCMTVCGHIRYTHGSVLSDRPTRPWPHRRPARLLHGLGSPHALGRHLHRALPARPSPPPAPRAHPPTHSAYTQHSRYRAQPSLTPRGHVMVPPTTVSCHGRSQLCSCRRPPPPRPAGRPASAHRCCGGLGDRAARARARARGRRPPPPPAPPSRFTHLQAAHRERVVGAHSLGAALRSQARQRGDVILGATCLLREAHLCKGHSTAARYLPSAADLDDGRMHAQRERMENG